MEELIKLIYKHKQLRKTAWDIDAGYIEACSLNKIEDKMYKIAKKLQKEMDNDRK